MQSTHPCLHSPIIANSLSLTLLCLIAMTPNAQAQTPGAEALKIQPKGSIGYSTSGGGFDGFGYLDGFIPLTQTPGANLWYSQVRGRFDNDANLSGTALLGYRSYDASRDQIFGGYIGYDGRSTDTNFFHQLGAGVEFLGDVEVRLNGYLPVGNSRQLASRSSSSATSTSTTGSTAITDIDFSGNDLLMTLGNSTTTTTTTTTSMQTFEAAVGGVDLEVGTQLLGWEGGHLKGYAGIYYQDPVGDKGTIGGRARLAAQITRNINSSIALSSDELFGTNITFQIGATFGGAPESQATEETHWLQMNGFAQRQSTLLIDQQMDMEVATTSTTTTTGGGTEVALNPATGQPWRFVHVTGGVAGGDGTFENPFGQVTDGVADAAANSGGIDNDIVYVQAGTNPGLDGFAIPDNVQVLSSGIAQTVDTTQIGIVNLPGSNSGVLPIINGNPSGVTLFGRDSMVSLGNNTTLAGFEVQGGGNHGVLVQNVAGATVLNNTITAAGFGERGIAIRATGAGNADNTTIQDNTVTVGGNGSAGILLRANGAVNNAVISGNIINTLGNETEGIFLDVNGGDIDNATVSGNTIDTAGTDARGIYLRAENRAVNAPVISGNTIDTTGDDGLGIYLRTINRNINNATVSGNTITTTQDMTHGIYFRADAGDIDDAMVSGNTVNTAGEDARGIYLRARGGHINNPTVSGNTIETTGDNAQGILVRAGVGGDVNDALVSTNTLNTTGLFSHGILVSANQGDINNGMIMDNTATTSGNNADGVRFRNTNIAGTDTCVALSGNNFSVVGAGGFGGRFQNPSGDPTRFLIVDQISILTDNIFVSTNPGNIDVNAAFGTVAVCP